jgi:hypothetical protein
LTFPLFLLWRQSAHPVYLTARPVLDDRRGQSYNACARVRLFGAVLPQKRAPLETHDIQRVLRARYGGVEASDVLVQFARIELERPDALTYAERQIL